MRQSIWRPQHKSQNLVATIALLVGWLMVETYLLAHHVMFRDEVRALSFALRGDNVIAMLKSLHGEGHPAIWYLLLRAAHTIVPSPVVLPVVAFVAALCAMMLLVLRSPFRPLTLALIMFGSFAAYEYSVMARNYGISMVPLFLFAIFYSRYKSHGVVLGVLLFVLANTNTFAALLTGPLLLFWLLDVLFDKGLRWTDELKIFFLNAAIAAVGAVVCFLTIYPLANDAAVVSQPPLQLAIAVLNGILFPAGRIGLHLPRQPAVMLFLSSLGLFASTFGLRHRPACMLSALAATVLMSAFFSSLSTTYPGLYRHSALFLVYLITMYWIAGAPPAPIHAAKHDAWYFLAPIGMLLFIALLALQFRPTVTYLLHPRGESQSRAFAELVKRTPAFKNAIIIADPDYLVEALPYYIPNETYLVRSGRKGTMPMFTRHDHIRLSLSDLLATASSIARTDKKPVLILINAKLDGHEPAREINEGYNWKFLVTPAMIAEFKKQTKLIGKFPAVNGDEFFDAYLFL